MSTPMVVDTMVFAYALLGVPDYRDAALATLREADPVIVPDSCYAELANVIWQWTRAKEIPEETGHTLLTDAETLIGRSLSTPHLWRQALRLATEADHPAYDTLFIAAAQHEGTLVTTFDQRLRATFPEWTREPGSL